MDYSKLSTDDLMALKKGDYSAVSTEGLKLLQSSNAKETQPKRQDIPIEDMKISDFTQNADLTPSGLFRTATNIAKSFDYSRKNNKDILNAYLDLKAQTDATPKNIVQKGLDVASTFALPQAKIAQAGRFAPFLNNLATGGYQGLVIGGVQGLQNNKGLEGAGTGAGIGATLTAGLPPAIKGAVQVAKLLPQTGNLLAKSIGRIQPETLKRAVQPDSVALDLTKDEAQNLLMNTTERIKNNYSDILNKKAGDIENAINKLKVDEQEVEALGLLTDIEDTFNQYGGSKINPARNMTGNLEDNLYNLVAQGTDEQGKISAIDLQKAKEQIGKMVRWDDMTAQNYYNPILEQIYGKYNTRLNQLSPQLKKANKQYSEVQDFIKNEGLRRILRKGDNIDTASSALRNYNSTVTKGNTNRNIQDLENLLVQEGYEPFLNNIDDVNAAMDLLNARSTGDSWLANIATQLTRPVLKAARGLNRQQIPQKVNNFVDQIGGLERYIAPGLYGAPAMMLQGGVEYNEY
jgi:hypothetical protein